MYYVSPLLRGVCVPRSLTTFSYLYFIMFIAMASRSLCRGMSYSVVCLLRIAMMPCFLSISF